MTLSPFEYPVDRVIGDFYGMTMHPRLPVAEIIGLHESGLSTDDDGDTLVDNTDPDVPFGWSVIEADDNMIISPEAL